MAAIVGLVLITLVLSGVLGLGIVGLSIWGVAKGARALGSAAKRLLTGEVEEPEHKHTPPTPDGARDVSSSSEPQRDAQDAKRTSGPREPAHPRSGNRRQETRSQAAQSYDSRPHDYEYLDVERGATPARIAQVMREYVDDYVAGDYAQAVIDALDTAEFRRKSLFVEIDSKFERNTISWDRFASTANAALDAIVRNCALLANRVQAFDSTDYARMEEFYSSGGFSSHGTQDSARLQRWKLIEETKREMDGIRATNESLLLELGKLATELAKLSSAAANEENSRIAEEVSRLVDETKYYR